MAKIHRTIAGNIEFFLGAYFVAACLLATLYFARMSRPHAALLATCGFLFGWLLVFRASRLLEWKPWIFWLMIIVLLGVTIVWYGSAILQLR
ncbi:MAG TPA: hypothetical protein VF980_01555 [Thermoanaerobaculia bacterium]